MKFFTSVLFLSISSWLYGQVGISSGDQHILSEIQKSVQSRQLNVLDEKYPIYSINGTDHLSMVAMVTESFSPTDLPKGIIPGTQINNIVTLKVPVDQLNKIQSLKSVRYIEIANRIQPEVAKAVLDLRADSVHQGLGLDNSYTGKNVIIGVTDWGFDYTHPMFYDTALQETRILASWDQFKTSGPAPSSMSYGTEYVGATELMTAQSDTACTYYDYATHGSHVAGIAGGSGAGIGLRGVAFESEYLFTAIHLDAGSVIDAVSWMKDFANAENKRLVINMSWGLYHLGPLDGTSLLSQALDGFVNDGVVIVTSGGNNGDVNFHIKKDFNQDSVVTTINFYNYNAHPSMWGQSVSMWGESGHEFRSGIEIYSGNTLKVKSPIYETATAVSYLDSMLITGTDTIFFNLATDAAHPQNQRPHMTLRVKNTNSNLRVVLKSYANTGTVHYHNVTELSNGAGNWGMPFTSFGPNSMVGDALYAVGEPACAKDVITVAAHTSEVRIPNGTVINGALANFSSEGPTIDERIKPDISAPGVSVESSISSFTTRAYTPTSSTTFNGRTYEFSKFSGTSMSSPAATGVVALMLEANPYLTPAQIKDILKTKARQDDKTGAIPATGSAEWGWGKVDAYAAVKEAVRILLSVEDQPIIEGVKVYPTVTKDYLNIQDVSGQPYRVKVFSINGQLVYTGSATQLIDVQQLPAGTYVLHLESDSDFGVMKFIKQ
ncbi:S8 family peptidase [bacterium SCSIO 12643]|nr:S8 family peptidase [bacterium SCSIO 12643]